MTYPHNPNLYVDVDGQRLQVTSNPETMSEESIDEPAYMQSGPIDVRIVPDKLHRAQRTFDIPADFGSFQSYVLTGAENPQRILPFTSRRKRATIMVTGILPTPGAFSNGPAVNSGAQGQILGQPGMYTYVTGYDASWNMGTIPVQGSVTGVPMPLRFYVDPVSTPNGSITERFPTPIRSTLQGGTIAVQFGALGAANINAQVTAYGYTAGASGPGIYLGTAAQTANNQGGFLGLGQTVTLTSEQEVWMNVLGIGNTITVTVLDERFRDDII